VFVEPSAPEPDAPAAWHKEWPRRTSAQFSRVAKTRIWETLPLRQTWPGAEEFRPVRPGCLSPAAGIAAAS
jgi:hypothetical protein